MPTVNDIIFCLNASNLPGQGVCANTILTTMTPEYIPGLFTFSVIITILDVDTTKEHELSISFCSPSEVLGELKAPLPVIEDHSNLPNEYKGINLTIDWNNMNFKENGEYRITILLDDAQIGEKSIYVKGKNQT